MPLLPRRRRALPLVGVLLTVSALEVEVLFARGAGAPQTVADASAVVEVEVDVRTTADRVIESVQALETTLPFQPGQALDSSEATRLSQRARETVRGWGSMSACCARRYRVKLRFVPDTWKGTAPVRLIGIEPYAPGGTLAKDRRILVQGRIDVDGRVHGISLEGAEGLEDMIRSAVAQWRYRPLAAPQKMATVLVVRPDR